MDTKGLIESLKTELTCSICLGYFTDPVTVKCGHSFCSECLLQCREEAGARFTCPECRGVIKDSNLIPNKSLQTLSITGKMLRRHLLQSMGDLTICEQHSEREKFFCEEEQRAVCESCSLAPEHRYHHILPLNRAADKYKGELQETQDILRRKEEEFQIALDKVRRNKEYCKEDSDFFKQSVRNEYKKMYQFLQNEENRHLQLLEQEFRENMAKLEERGAKLSQQMRNLQRAILEVEEDLDKAPLKMLQDRKNLLEMNGELLPQELEIASSRWSSCPITGLRQVLKSFQRDITLDPHTADPHLILSEDLKRVEYRRVPEDLPDDGGRLGEAFSVLGAQTFTSGKHYWEVELGDNVEWDVGVCEVSDSTNGESPTLLGDIISLEGFKSENDFFIWKSNESCHLSKRLEKLGIFLDYENGHVAFYHVTEECLLYSTPVTNFQGPLRPYFSIFINSEEGTPTPLVICPRKDQ